MRIRMSSELVICMVLGWFLNFFDCSHLKESIQIHKLENNDVDLFRFSFSYKSDVSVSCDKRIVDYCISDYGDTSLPIAQLATKYPGVQSTLHLTRGTWRNTWGMNPSFLIPPDGALFTVQYPNKSKINYPYFNDLRVKLSSLLCTNLATDTLWNKPYFLSKTKNLNNSTIRDNLILMQWSPADNLCNNHITKMLTLLPCNSKSPLASIINSTWFIESPWMSVSFHILTSTSRCLPDPTLKFNVCIRRIELNISLTTVTPAGLSLPFSSQSVHNYPIQTIQQNIQDLIQLYRNNNNNNTSSSSSSSSSSHSGNSSLCNKAPLLILSYRKKCITGSNNENSNNVNSDLPVNGAATTSSSISPNLAKPSCPITPPVTPVIPLTPLAFSPPYHHHQHCNDFLQTVTTTKTTTVGSSQSVNLWQQYKNMAIFYSSNSTMDTYPQNLSDDVEHPSFQSDDVIIDAYKSDASVTSNLEYPQMIHFSSDVIDTRQIEVIIEIFIRNNHPYKAAYVTVTQPIPSFLNILLHTSQFHKLSHNNNNNSTKVSNILLMNLENVNFIPSYYCNENNYYCNNKNNINKYSSQSMPPLLNKNQQNDFDTLPVLTFGAEINPLETITVTLTCRKVFLTRESHPPDASRGIEVPPAIASIIEVKRVLPPSSSSSSSTTCQFSCEKDSSLKEVVDTEMYYEYTLWSQPVLVTLPIPDASMVYNVITLVCTLAAFLFGSMINTLGRKSSRTGPNVQKSN